jgi:hypothetical protein
MPLQATSGAASYDAFGGGVPAVPNYIEEVFSTYLYTGNGSTQTITNGIDLSGKGGMTWIKYRNSSDYGTHVFDTVRGVNRALRTNSTAAQNLLTDTLTAFNSNGFSLGNNNDALNFNGGSYASWTFRKQPKFFDVLTYTGTGSTQTIAHNLGSVPSCIIVKQTSASGEDWSVYHVGLNAVATANQVRLRLNSTGVVSSSTSAFWNNTTPTSTVFSVGTDDSVNANGAAYVAYLFAHNAGGFGLTGTDNVISCGSFTQASGGTTVNLGYEPQWVLVKNTGTGNWFIFDNMRGNTNTLYPNLSNAEGDQGAGSFQYNATGFTMADYITGSVGSTIIYIAIRRGPMKVPTSGTSVFAPVYEGSTTPAVQTSFPVDFGIWTRKDLTSDRKISSRLQGSKKMYTNLTSEEGSNDANLKWDYQNGYKVSVGASGDVDINWVMRRAPSFFDVVCYTGTNTTTGITHNLSAVPEMYIIKRRDFADGQGWMVYHKDAIASGAANAQSSYLTLNSTAAVVASTSRFGNVAPTSTTFGVSASSANESGATYVAYLFATCGGVSKVGSYTGNGTTLQIDCGFTAGSRFVLIKRTDSTGDWYVWDSARGIVAGDDPYLLLNSTATEVTGTDYVDTYSAGFEITSTAPAAINASGGTFIFFAVA